VGSQVQLGRLANFKSGHVQVGECPSGYIISPNQRVAAYL
jgi:hypothetical protein